ncbi:DNA circularization N-terminal domain-containing protein [Methylobacterium gnaphalii]|uniref:DNA circulation N-terminal domain-containing protein n=1 Tax=Methylobacterium gnaphalii TaxID=1010610 RepID=A0A512JIM8_9HYPH|nr:DNA circularization N-terminal domain-containing protein [Methylobacterium gnaphalii]GEP09806.1 hypothetical protein MGN01_16510 [Methylobacterium gnaphalii]GJD67279.1 hypothetical protein MMMDOFMJ_0193 [Methylobacterium gnaphalii]GLS49836.1 hypothetical protein GCM10007885_26880 [Methylobacterium gnaphalii]
MSWRDELRPPSFRGVPFRIEANTRFGGRRGFTYEFAKSERSLDEDLGRRVTRVVVSAYVIGDDYTDQAEALEDALNREGGGTLILPTLGSMFMRPDAPFSRIETREQGGIARFEISFVDAGGSTSQLFTENTQAAANTAASTLSDDTDLSAGNDTDWL